MYPPRLQLVKDRELHAASSHRQHHCAVHYGLVNDSQAYVRAEGSIVAGGIQPASRGWSLTVKTLQRRQNPRGHRRGRMTAVITCCENTYVKNGKFSSVFEENAANVPVSWK